MDPDDDDHAAYWREADEVDDDFEDGSACLNCGMCEWCIDRSIAATEEAEPRECSMCPAFIWSEESLRTGKCLGCRSPGPQFVVGKV